MSSFTSMDSVGPLPSKGRIDIHTHIIPSSCPNWNVEFGDEGWLNVVTDEDGQTSMRNSDGSLFRKIDKNCFCPATRIEECDRDKVTIQVLSTVPGIGFNYDKNADRALKVAVFLNDHIAQVVSEGNGRFVGLCTVPMQDIDLSVTELRRCVEDLKMVGVQIGSHICGKTLDDPIYEPLWTECERLDCAIFVHPWDMSTAPRLQKHWFPWLLGMPHETAIAMASMIFGGVFERHPNLRICFAHGGGCFPGLIGRLSHGFHARPDLCQTMCQTEPKAFLRNVYIDSLVHDSDILQLIVKKFGSDRIILGSDYPFPLGEIDYPGRVIDETYCGECGAEARDDMLWRNAVRFLKLNLTEDGRNIMN